jgi:hypothetical protein
MKTYSPSNGPGGDGVLELEHLLWITHGPYGSVRPLLMLTAYLDESQDSKRERFLVVAGFLAPADVWAPFWKEWDEALTDEDIPAFHAKDCEHGKSHFEGFSPERRAEIQRRFIGIITAHPGLLGHGTAIELPAYEELRPELRRFFQIVPGGPVSGDTSDPYFFAWQLTIQLIAKLPWVEDLPSEERIAFVFDQNDFKGRALDSFAGLRHARRVLYRHRLGTIAFDDHRIIKPLQAADILAYELFRFAEDQTGGRPPRWQFEELRKHIKLVQIYDRESLLEALEGMKEMEVERAWDVEMRGNKFHNVGWQFSQTGFDESV